jgi:RHS repeat-associated protein
MTYDATGNILTSQLEGGAVSTNDYQTQQPGCSYYANTQPHAQHSTTNTDSGTMSFCYDANGNGTQEFIGGSTYGASTWTSFNQPYLMSLYDGSSSQFSYTGDHQRWKQVATFFDGSSQTTEYIGGLFDKITNSNGTAYEYYIPAGNTIVEYTRWSTGDTFLDYITKDHLGSSALITDSTGAPVVTESFAALGYRRSSTGWAGPPSDAEWQGIDSTTTRGFTGQEMVDHLGVVNMNGRIYMETGEFASPDPFISDPADTQSYNRYSYVLNNPLTYVDPSGFDPVCFTLYSPAQGDSITLPDGTSQVTVPSSGVSSTICSSIPTIPDYTSSGGGSGGGGGASNAPPYVPPKKFRNPVLCDKANIECGDLPDPEKFANQLCHAGNSAESGSEKLAQGSLALETVGGAITLTSALSANAIGAEVGGGLMATGGIGTIGASAMQATGGLLQVLATNGRAGWSNVGYGLLGGGIGVGLIRAGNAIKSAGGSVTQRAFNSSADAGAAAAGLANDALGSAVSAASPSEVECPGKESANGEGTK